MNNILVTIKNLSRQKKIVILLIVDITLAFMIWLIFGPPFSSLIAASFDIRIIDVVIQNIFNFALPCLALLIYFFISGFYRTSIRFSDSRDLISRSLKGSLIFGFSWGIVYLFEHEIIRNSYVITVLLKSLLIAFVFYGSLQISRDLSRLMIYQNRIRDNGKPVLIYGAGSAGNELFHAIKNNKNINIIGFFDNSNALNGSEINNIKIFGKNKQIKKLAEKYKNLEIYLAIPSLTMSQRRIIISDLEKYKVSVRSIPALHEIIADQKKMVEMQDLSIDEILPRARVKHSSVSMFGLNIMVTGAGGSIGSEIVRQVLSGNPKKIVLYEISEINLYSIRSEVEALKKLNSVHVEIVGILGDVKDAIRAKQIISSHKIDVIYHAAAYKHVPIVEYHENICEGIKNNVFGTKVICDSATELGVDKVVVISTDKAVRPTNIMGASKRMAEMVVQSADHSTKNTTFCMVRFGNVINSSGSVVPLFRKQISEGGPVTITHNEVTRFFMTISEASSLVIQAGEFATGGDVFILDMGKQVKIRDLAEKLIYLSGMSIKHRDEGEGIEIQEIGLRPGEKLYEELLISGSEIKTPNSKIFKSVEKHLSKNELDGAILDLQKYVTSNDVLKIKNILNKYVEGFGEADGQIVK
jgi:UDP-N-acetylglucosamine 4,6-dehydratase